MEHSIVAKKLNESLKDIFAFSVSHLYNKQDAEDLTNDIIVEVLSSADRLENDDAFYGYMWKIADHTLKRYIRGKKRSPLQLPDDFPGVYWDVAEDKLIADEELANLRRELSLLSKQYRDVTIKFYIEHKSCAFISKELGISEEMVKYYLFKTRKILKEGVMMTREYGEKSYNPSNFGINFWGCGGPSYVWETFDRKLPGNIVLAAYEKPRSMQELSLELGVSVPYLEDEIDILMRNQFIKQIGNKYQTDFVIFSSAYESNFLEQVPATDICTETAGRISVFVDSVLPRFRKKDFGIHMDDNQLRWFIVNFALHNALGIFEARTQERLGHYPKLNATTQGFVYGHDNGYPAGYFCGIYGRCDNRDRTAWFSAVNYNVILSCQQWRGGSLERFETLCNSILRMPVSDQNKDTVSQLASEGFITVSDGKTKANFPVFTSKERYLMEKKLQEIINLTVDCMEKICGMAYVILKTYTPQHLYDRCEHLCYVRHQADAMGIIVEKLVADKYLIVPEERTNLCMYGVIQKSDLSDVYK